MNKMKNRSNQMQDNIINSSLVIMVYGVCIYKN